MEIYFPVNIGRIAEGTSEEALGHLVISLGKDLHGLSDELSVLGGMDCLLTLHQRLAALMFCCGRYMIGHIVCLGSLLAGIFKYTETVKLHFIDKVAHSLIVFLGLAREAGYKGCTQNRIGDLRSDALDR